MKIHPLPTRHLLLIAAAVLAYALPAQAAVETGSAAPDFTLTDTTGQEHSLSDFKGKFVVLEWTNHLCPFVVKHYSSGNMQSLQEQLTADGAVWLQIVSSAEGKQGHVSPEEGEALRESQDVNSTAMLLDSDGTVGKAYDARTTPHMYLINPDGVLVYQGAIDSIRSTDPADIDKAENYLLSAYSQAKAGEPVEKGTTQPYGCSVKY